jgi:hypothetical protein
MIASVVQAGALNSDGISRYDRCRNRVRRYTLGVRVRIQ